MFARRGVAIATLALAAAVGGVLGCLQVFGPDLRARGAHGGVPEAAPADACMGCHESEADALARLAAAKAAELAAHDSAHVTASPHDHSTPTSSPASSMAAGPPLVADWMVADERACTACHRVRP